MDEVLYLPLKRQWFEMIKSGEKPVEYRELTPYWISRLFCWCEIRENNSLGIGKISMRDARVLANERELLFYGYLMDKIMLKQPNIVEFSLGYPKGDDSSRRFRMRVRNLRLGMPRKKWAPDEACTNKLCICIYLGEMIEE